MAALSADSYHATNPTDTSAPVGWTRASELSPQALARYGLSQELLSPANSGFRAELYIPNADNPNPDAVATLAFKGTTPTQAEDWANNFTQATGRQTDYYDRAMQLATRVDRATAGQVEFTGHSLGGGMASAASAVTGNEAVTFNAAGLHPNTGAQYMQREGLGTPQNADQLADLVTVYQVEGDILTTLQETGNQIDPVRADQIGDVVSFAAGVANNPFVQSQTEQQTGTRLGDFSGLMQAQGSDLLNMPEAAGQQVELPAIEANGQPPAVQAAQFVGPNGIATRADAILDQLDASNALAEQQAQQIRDDGGFGAGIRATAFETAAQVSNANTAYQQYSSDPVLQNAGTALNESVNRHVIFESSLSARVDALEARADALLQQAP